MFDLGHIVITNGIEALEDEGLNIYPLIRSHQLCDWGDICEEDRGINEEALINGDRLMSVYKTDHGTVWLITEWDRSVTTVLLPSEY